MERALQLKRMVAIDGQRYPRINPLNVHAVMKTALAAAHTVGDRHFPKKENVTAGKRCIFIEPSEKTDGNSCLFHVYAYTAGLTPDQVVADFDAEKADITADPIIQHGEKVEVVERFACLVYGDALIMENARVYGASNLAIRAIRDLIRRHANSKYPNLYLEDAPTKDFKRLAAEHGGVSSVTARLNSGFVPEPNSFGKALESLFESKKLNKYKQVSASIQAEDNDELDPDDVLEILDESEGSTGLSSVSVAFRDGTTLSDLVTYRERHRLNVQVVSAGKPAVSEIESGMVDYLKSLVMPDDDAIRVIDADGKFV